MVLASLLAGLLLLEGGLALFYPQEELNLVAENVFFVQHDQEIGWVNKENSEGAYRVNPGAPEVRVRINGLGFRGGPMEARKPDGARRVLVLGDSIAFGQGVEEEDTFPSILARMLPGGYQVINASVVGYGTDQEYLLLAREGLRLLPDVVVLGFTPGDVMDNMSSVMFSYNKPYFKLTDGGISLRGTPVPEAVYAGRTLLRGMRVRRALYEHSHLARLLFNRLGWLDTKVDQIEEMSREDGLRLTIALLTEMKRLCEENGARFFVLQLPNRRWMEVSRRTGKKEGFYNFITMMMERAGIEVIDPYDELMERFRTDEALFLPRDVHMAPPGQRITAAVLYRGLLSAGAINSAE